MTPGYSDQFYRTRGPGARASADVVVSCLAELGLGPFDRVLDLGCGRGDWLAAFGAGGSPTLVGLDGPWNSSHFSGRGEVDFRSADLEHLGLDAAGASFDLALSVEVLEHLSPAAGDRAVQHLAASAPVVLFSAAVPGQGGTGHRNEQWPSYWAERFGRHGYEVFDLLRPRLWSDPRVNFWYRQNLLLFARPDSLPGLVPSRHEALDLVHPELLAQRRRQPLAGDWLAGTRALSRSQLGRLRTAPAPWRRRVTP
jgi:SAM-dependent methyltransferase